VAKDKVIALTATGERPASTLSGYPMLLAALLAVVLDAYGIARVTNSDTHVSGLILILVGTIMFVLILPGFYMLQPNQAVAITLFGDYRGTDRVTGLRWTWPWMGKKKVSVRANNFISDKIKVNDLRGNPIDIAAQIMWRVVDTAQALFDVDSYDTFLNIQIETSLREITSHFAYDNGDEDEPTLRADGVKVGEMLQSKLQERIAVAGLLVDEARLSHLAYAPEIAGAMLRRQQAEAVLAARQKIVMGAVSMVESALQQLSEREIVALDDERKAAMVSNLLVVLCADRDAQPVVNAGTLYQ